MKKFHFLLTFSLLFAPLAQAAPRLIEVAPGKNAPYFAPDTVFARTIESLNKKIAANPNDGELLARRAVQWVKCEKLATNLQPKPSLKNPDNWLALPAGWRQKMDADIARAAEVDAKNPRVFEFTVVALTLAAQREMRDNAVDAALSPAAAQKLQANIADLELRTFRALKSGNELGDKNAEGTKAWFLFKKIARTEADKRPPLLGALGALKIAPSDVQGVLSRAAAFILAPDEKVSTKASLMAEQQIGELAKAYPQVTHDAMSMIARILNLSSSEAAKKWQIRAAQIPGVTLCADNLLLAWRFNPQRTDAMLSDFVTKLSPFFEPSPYGSERLRLMEQFAAWCAAKGNWTYAAATREAICATGGKPGNWAELGDMQYQKRDYGNAAASYETFAIFGGDAVDGHPMKLEIGFMYALGFSGFSIGSINSLRYYNAIFEYDKPLVLAHQKLVESQLQKTPKNPVLKSVLGEMNTRFGDGKPNPLRYNLALAGPREASEFQISDQRLTSAITNEQNSFRLYAPKP